SSTSESSSAEEAYTIEEEPRESVFMPLNKVKYVKKRSGNKKPNYLVMGRKSKNNHCKSIGKFTTSPTQYLPLCNLIKYEHTLILFLQLRI
ncbi:8783_t:CDS:2, partial [Funneliformis mosseae]